MFSDITDPSHFQALWWLVCLLADLAYAWFKVQQAKAQAEAQRPEIIQMKKDEMIYQHWRESCDSAFKDPTLSLPKPPFWPDVVRLLSSGRNPAQRQKDEKKRWHPERLHFTQRRKGAPAWASKLFIAIQNAEV